MALVCIFYAPTILERSINRQGSYLFRTSGDMDGTPTVEYLQTLIFLQRLLVELYEKTFLTCEFKGQGPLSYVTFRKLMNSAS